MLTFKGEIQALAAAVEAAANLDERGPNAVERKATRERFAETKNRIVDFLAARPLRKRWTATTEIAEHLGETAYRAGQWLRQMRHQGLLDRRQFKSRNAEWKLR